MPAAAVRSRLAISAAYAAQGLGYAVVVTSLPTLKARQGIDDTTVSLIVLLVCVAAAGGSVLADALARWRGSRIALATGLTLEVAGLALILIDSPMPLFVTAFAIYGLGLGAVDASGAMQGVLVQRRYGRDLMGGFFASYTAAAILGALAVAGAAALGWQSAPFIVAALVLLVVALLGLRAFDPERAAAPVGARATRPLPRRGIWLFGFIILAAFTLDSGVSTWSTVYLQDDLAAAAIIAPLGYAAYQLAILVTRLVTDRSVDRWGPRPVAVLATATSIAGLLLVALLPFPVAAVVGFALAGVAVGALVPLSFTSAGELDPSRSDEIIARVNLFNYAGAVLGAVAIGLLADAPGLQLAFLIPAVLLIPVFFVVRRFRAPSKPAARRDAASADR
ncbi:MFS transporter [Microbacterium pygmaeum]|uniref:Predicted arabinose efflux permease, MFS family n=1 Tax=Microbacterium pygmaeum TaxID=370764 RepID=A0A1G8D0A0_9MICO|nr:MFS transporter [Microbacterium pygmaeum]SDH51082.1 Predicted arabinose efflux permease, MFS family [Microbacterium pygmaeum]